MLDHVATLFPGTPPGDFVLVHGDCRYRRKDGSIDWDRSADQLAAQEATKRGWRTEAHPVDWDAIDQADWGPAGRARNQHMVDLGARLCIAFPGGNGTWHCKDAAQKAGIAVIRLADIPA